MAELIHLCILSALFLAIFAIGEVAYRFFHVNAEYTRKWSHIASGFLSLLFPSFFHSILIVGVICALFALILNFSRPLGILPSINSVERKTYGSVLFPLAVFLSYMAYKLADNNLLYFYLPVLTLAICDLCAALVGKRFPIRRLTFIREPKSLGGFLAFFISAVILYVVFLCMGKNIGIGAIIAVALMGAVAELLSPSGFDNVSIPLVVILGLFIFN